MITLAPVPLGKIKTVSCVFIVLLHGLVQASDLQDDASPRHTALRQEVLNQSERINALKRSVAEQEASLDQLRRAVGTDALAEQRGKGADGVPAQNAQVMQAGDSPVGKTPEKNNRPPEVTPIFEQQGVLTPKGKLVMEPSLLYSYSSNNRVALIGYTIVPALLIGLVDVREVKRNTMTAALSGRVGITNRFEMEVRVPYMYRSDTTVSREVGSGSATDRVFEASGKALGDVELGARYQFNDGGVDKPYYVGTLRFKSRTGRDPFEVVTDCAQRCVGNTTGTGLPLELPTGSGFYSLQTGLTWLMPSDPAVFFGSFTYLHNFKRTDVSRKVLDGNSELLGTIEPGAIFGINFGMGLALNDKASFSIGYDHNSVGKIRQNGQVVPGSVRTQLGTMLLGYSYRLSDARTLIVSVGAGLTRDTPDLTLSVKLPISF